MRASPATPAVVLLRYNDCQGLLALGIDVDGPAYQADEAWLRETASPFPVSDPPYATPPHWLEPLRRPPPRGSGKSDPGDPHREERFSTGSRAGGRRGRGGPGR